MAPPIPPDDPPWDALARYFAGELPPDEAQELERWITADSERVEMVAHLREVWREADQRQSWNAEAALRRIKQAPAGPARVIRLPERYHDEPTTGWRRAIRAALRVAAAAVLAAGGVGLWWAAWRSGASSGQIATSEVTTPRGQRASLRLPDGTQVTLGPASTIRYAVARDRGPRSVQLEGAAYFVVAHDSARPFTVQTPRGTATDLGTRFGVQAYTSDSAVDVVVTEGRVALAPARDTLHAGVAAGRLVLGRGDVGRVTADGRVSAQHVAHAERYLAWTQGRLEFRDTPMRDAVVQLGRWYDLDLQLADTALGSKRLTASFKDESAAEVVRLVAASLDLRADWRGNAVTLRSK